MKRKIMKIFAEIISNTKIFYINFFLNEVVNDQDFAKPTGGTRQRGAGQRRIQYYKSTVFDIFRKVDLAANGFLSAAELNQFGKIIDNNKFTSIKQADFKTKKFENISWTSEGLTFHGFLQFLFKNLKSEEIESMLKKLGYDDQLRSLKSRVNRRRMLNPKWNYIINIY